MDWQRDPKTGEWVVIDPMTQSTTGQESDPALRDPPPMPPSPSGEEGYNDPALRAIPLSPPGARAYQNEDYTIIDRWVQEVQARGNEVRKTAAGTFEVDSGGRIVSPMPSPYRVN
jgi:hypothetical protein